MVPMIMVIMGLGNGLSLELLSKLPIFIDKIVLKFIFCYLSSILSEGRWVKANKYMYNEHAPCLHDLTDG